MSSSCPICFDPLVSSLVAMPCGHVFHEACAESSLKLSKICPICRAPCKRAQKLFIDCYQPSPQHLIEIEENKAVQRAKQLTVELELANHLVASAKGEIEELTKANLTWQLETKELLEFKSTCSERELQLRRDLKSVTEERNDLAQRLLARRNAESEMETAVDNLRGENKMLKHQNTKQANQINELQHALDLRTEDVRVLRASTIGLVGKPRSVPPFAAVAATRPFPLPAPVPPPAHRPLIAPITVQNKRPKQSFEQFLQVAKNPNLPSRARAPTGKQSSLNHYF